MLFAVFKNKYSKIYLRKIFKLNKSCLLLLTPFKILACYIHWSEKLISNQLIFNSLSNNSFSGSYFQSNPSICININFISLPSRDGKPVSVPENINSLYQEVLEDLKIHEIDRKFIKPFMCFGFDTFQAGISGLKTGGIIGIPVNFTYKTARDLEANRLMINKVPVDWARQETEDLAQSLVLSQEAQKFAIAREILNFQEFNKLWDCIVASILFISSYAFCQWIKHKYDMYNKPLASRLILYTVGGFGGVGIYFAQKDFLRKRAERKVDEKLSQISPTYVKGGLEFYSKLLARNIAHRSLLDKHGHELFTEDGNFAYFIRQKTTPITKRKSLFESRIKEFMQEQEKKLDNDLKKIAGDIEKV